MTQGSNAGVGLEVPGAHDDRGSVRDVLGPDTEAGQAFLVAMLGLGLVYLSMPKGRVVPRIGATLQTVAFVGGASLAFHYFARVWVTRHPDAPLAMGVHYDA